MDNARIILFYSPHILQIGSSAPYISLHSSDLKEGVGCRVWGVGKETSFICGGENFFIGTDSLPHS
ncbi:hypothetical protein RVR34_15925 [Microcystis aeruginosa FBCC-A68]|uniref:hypothetical protein n=1 Tax=Microcystis aeruginosa TaxID=1126 RepID=UPI001482DED1|nr:hypothetical protein [Microcystis aeruginosa]